MKGVRFGNYHSYDSWGLILSAKEIQSPTPKTNQIEIEGSDGVLDYSEYFGEVKYNNRSLTFTFTAMNTDFVTLYSTIHNAIHGQKMKVILDDEPDFYFFGRVTVNEWKSDKNLREIVVEVDAEPYKMKNALTSVSVTVDGTSHNFYNVHDLDRQVGKVTLANDDFIHFDFENTSATYYSYMLAKPSSDILPNTKYRILFELSSEEDLIGNISFMWQSDSAVTKDQFMINDTKSLTGYIHERFTYNTKTKTEVGFAEASTAIRFLFGQYGETSGKLKVRVSILPADTDVKHCDYVSHDGLMKGFCLKNLRKRVVPTITASAPCTILFEGNSFAINAGTHTIPEIELKQGMNEFAVRGLATVTFSYREGGL